MAKKKYYKGKPSKPTQGSSRNYKHCGSQDREGRRHMDDNKTESKDDRLSGLNDFSWYNRNPALTYAASRIPFPYRPGMQVPVGLWTGSDNETSTLEYEVPGIAALYWVPTVGRSGSATDPASIVGKEIFARVRKVYSGSIDADAPDFVIYLLALDSIFSYIGALKRIYRILNAYTPYNHYLPDGLLRAMGLTETGINNLKADRMGMFSVINQLIKMTEKFKCPKVFDYFNRHYWMNDNVYTDAPTPNSQMYVFVQDAYYKYTLTELMPSGVKVGSVTMVGGPFEISSLTTTNLFTFGRNLIDALAGSDDAYIISGYLMRAFEGETEFRVDDLQLDEKFEPVFVPEVLSQIENSKTLYHYWPSNSLDTNIAANNSVTQDPATNAIICTPSFVVPKASVQDWAAFWHPNEFMSIRNDTPSEQDVVIASRLMASATKFASADTGDSYAITCGTEIPIRWTLNRTDATNVSMSIPQLYSISQTETLTTGTFRQLMAMMRITNFDWSPFVTILGYSSVSESEPTPFISTWLLGDTHNYTSFTQDVLRELHKICLYSEFNSFGIDT